MFFLKKSDLFNRLQQTFDFIRFGKALVFAEGNARGEFDIKLVIDLRLEIAGVFIEGGQDPVHIPAAKAHDKSSGVFQVGADANLGDRDTRCVFDQHFVVKMTAMQGFRQDVPDLFVNS